MPSLAILTTSASAGRITPTKPVLQFHAVGQFKISDATYNPSLNYSFSVTSGTATPSGQIVTMSAPNSVCTVTATSPKLGSSSSTYERKNWEYYQFRTDSGCNPINPCPCSDPGCSGQAGPDCYNCCGCVPYSNPVYSATNFAPTYTYGGGSNTYPYSGGEWYRYV